MCREKLKCVSTNNTLRKYRQKLTSETYMQWATRLGKPTHSQTHVPLHVLELVFLFVRLSACLATSSTFCRFLLSNIEWKNFVHRVTSSKYSSRILVIILTYFSKVFTITCFTFSPKCEKPRTHQMVNICNFTGGVATVLNVAKKKKKFWRKKANI